MGLIESRTYFMNPGFWLGELKFKYFQCIRLVVLVLIAQKLASNSLYSSKNQKTSKKTEKNRKKTEKDRKGKPSPEVVGYKYNMKIDLPNESL